MGLEISDEFFPITPIRTSVTRNLNSTVSPLTNERKENQHCLHDLKNKNAAAKRRITVDVNRNDLSKLQTDLVSTTNIRQDLVNTTAEFDKDCEDGEEEECCTTPKSEGNLLKAPLVCPPAPRKPKPLKRKSSSELLFFQQVPADLTCVFFAFPPCSKKIRAG